MRIGLELKANPPQLAGRFSVPAGGARTDRPQVDPGGWGAVIRDSSRRNMELLRWGVSGERLGQDGSRLETEVRIEDLVGRRGPTLLERRLLVPVSAFLVGAGGVTRRFSLSDGGLLAVAGIWDIDGHWRGRPLRCFRIVTGPGDVMARLPLVLQPDNERVWLDPFATDAALLDALEPLDEGGLEIG
ncbi:MAG: SOS response-associated peptidase family protein [bacterium]